MANQGHESCMTVTRKSHDSHKIVTWVIQCLSTEFTQQSPDNHESHDLPIVVLLGGPSSSEESSLVRGTGEWLSPLPLSFPPAAGCSGVGEEAGEGRCRLEPSFIEAIVGRRLTWRNITNNISTSTVPLTGVAHWGWTQDCALTTQRMVYPAPRCSSQLTHSHPPGSMSTWDLLYFTVPTRAW